jgi:hypothetical protein
MVLLRPLPESVRTAVEAFVGCIAGASLVDDLRRMMLEAGLAELRLTPKPAYVAALTTSDDPLYGAVQGQLPVGTTPADVVTSMDIAARKPVAGACCVPGSGCC